ncbi:MAG: circadian clock KaiB family protein [Planctomycetota bacterium]
MDKKINLKLYVMGEAARAKRSIDQMEEIMESNFPGKYTLEVIDLMKRPQLAEDEKIMATPTVIKELPPPLRKIVGDLSDEHKVLVGLDLETEN